MVAQIDTNFLLEFLFKNHPERAANLRFFFERIKAGKRQAVLSEPVFLETTVVLRNYYKLSHERIAELLEQILAQDWLEIENRDIISFALRLYTENSLDMTDCLLLARASLKKQTIATFDTKLEKLMQTGRN